MERKPKNPNLTRINFQVRKEFHQEVKQRALARGVTMTHYVYKAIWEQLKKERQYDQ